MNAIWSENRVKPCSKIHNEWFSQSTRRTQACMLTLWVLLYYQMDSRLVIGQTFWWHGESISGCFILSSFSESSLVFRITCKNPTQIRSDQRTLIKEFDMIWKHTQKTGTFIQAEQQKIIIWYDKWPIRCLSKIVHFICEDESLRFIFVLWNRGFFMWNWDTIIVFINILNQFLFCLLFNFNKSFSNSLCFWHV